MGNKSSTTFRRVQPSLSHSSKYNRLSSSSESDAHKPLLFNNCNENMEMLKHDMEENRKKNESLERRNVILEKDILELKSTVSKLESKSKSGQTGTESDTSALIKKIENLEVRLKKLEDDPLMIGRNQDAAIVVERNSESNNQLVDLTLIDEMPAISPVTDLLGTSMDQEFGNPGHHSTDDLVGCLIILIFLVTVLIGLNL